MALNKPVVSGRGLQGSSMPALDCEVARRHGTIVEFLALPTWADGQSRTPGTLTLMRDGDLWKACLNDRESECSAFVSGKTLTSLLAAVEKGLAAGSLEWRAWKPFADKASKKKGGQ